MSLDIKETTLLNNNGTASMFLKFPFRRGTSVCVLACVITPTTRVDTPDLPDVKQIWDSVVSGYPDPLVHCVKWWTHYETFLLKYVVKCAETHKNRTTSLLLKQSENTFSYLWFTGFLPSALPLLSHPLCHSTRAVSLSFSPLSLHPK